MSTVPSLRPQVSHQPQQASAPRASSYRRIRTRALTALCTLLLAGLAFAGVPAALDSYKVLPAIVHGNLAIFPVIGGQAHDTAQLLTLDEGVRSGQVTITEAGDQRGLIRPGQSIPQRQQGAEVNRLVLYNNSTRPLLLLAGEIVTGGKQDRVIGTDRIIPPNTGPIDLGVFCVEPGRWVASSSSFGSMGAQMAQPSVRTPAMADKDQSRVWDNVRSSNAKMASNLSAQEIIAVEGTTSYAKVFASPPVQKMVAQYGGTEGQQALLRELRSKGALGVVVAINGKVLWADLFASTDLLTRYWAKLMPSYVAEAITFTSKNSTVNIHDAESYIANLNGGREVAETEPGVYRRVDITGDGYRVFELISLLPKTGFLVHLAKTQTQPTEAALAIR